MNTFPNPIHQNGRIFFLKRAVENHIRELAGVPPIEGDDVSLIPAAEAAKILRHRTQVDRPPPR